MNAKSIILKKRSGGRHTREELRFLIEGALAGRIAEYHLTAWMMAVFFQGMDPEETADLARVMIDSGSSIRFPEDAFRPVDKHSTGGVGDKLSFLLAPLVAAAGAPVPMISGRSLGHTGGTLDKLESIPGYRTDLGPDAFRDQVARIGLAISGQSADLVPADRLLYSLRDAASIVESIPLITASILSKKSAEGARALVLDVKVGTGAFMIERARGEELARQLVRTASALGMRARAYLTRMDEVLGRTAGNALEIRESILALRDGPESTSPDLRELTLELGAGMLDLSGAVATVATGRQRLHELWSAGAGFDKLRELIEAQGGDVAVVDDPTRLPTALETLEVSAPRAGTLLGITARPVGDWITESGGGRLVAGAPIDPTIGLEILCEPGATVQSGQPVLRLHVAELDDETDLRERAQGWIRVGDAREAPGSAILQIIEGDPTDQ